MTGRLDADLGIGKFKGQIETLSPNYSFWGRKFILADKKTPRSLKEILNIYSDLWNCAFSEVLEGAPISAEIKDRRYELLMECRGILLKADKTSDEKFFAEASNSFSQRILSIWIRFIRLFLNSQGAINSLSTLKQNPKYQDRSTSIRVAKMLDAQILDSKEVQKRRRQDVEASLANLSRWGISTENDSSSHFQMGSSRIVMS